MRILVVDDEELICWSLKRSLENRAGHSVCCVYTGNEAMVKIIGNEYDMIITDLKLPDISGLDLLKKIKALGLDTPVILISSNFDGVLSELENYGVFRCINKPFKIEELLQDVYHWDPSFAHTP